MGAIGQFFGWIAVPIYYAISGILLVWHRIFGFLPGGWAWALSIVGLTLTIRVLLIPLFVKQIKSSRNMQLIQPKVKELQKKYGHDRERLAQETMKLYKDAGTNPFASCLPLLLQMPIFLVLFRMLNHASHGQGKGFMTNTQASQLSGSHWIGALLSDSFTRRAANFVDSVGPLPGSVKILCGFLVVLMIATTFLTQRQLMSKNMPADAMTGQYAQQQKMMLYVLPLVFALGGLAFPIGVLLYWCTSNLWTMGQQFYVIRNNPAPNTEAFRAKEARDRAKAARHGVVLEKVEEVEAPVEEQRSTQRQQPKRQSKSQRQSNQRPTGRPTDAKKDGKAK